MLTTGELGQILSGMPPRMPVKVKSGDIEYVLADFSESTDSVGLICEPYVRLFSKADRDIGHEDSAGKENPGKQQGAS